MNNLSCNKFVVEKLSNINDDLSTADLSVNDSDSHSPSFKFSKRRNSKFNFNQNNPSTNLKNVKFRIDESEEEVGGPILKKLLNSSYK